MRRFTLLTLIALLVLPILSPLFVPNDVYADTIAATDQERIKKYYVSELVRLCFSNDRGETLETSVPRNASGKPHDFTFNGNDCDGAINELVEKVAPGIDPINFFELGGEGFVLNPKNERYELRPESKAKKPGVFAQSIYNSYTGGEVVKSSDLDIKAGAALASITTKCESVDSLGSLTSLQSGSDDQKIEYEKVIASKSGYIIGTEIVNNVAVPSAYKYKSKSQATGYGSVAYDCEGAIKALSTARKQIVARVTSELFDKKYDAFMGKLQQDICRSYPGVAIPGGGINEGALNDCRVKVKSSYESCTTNTSVKPGGPSAQGGKIIDSSDSIIACVTKEMRSGVPESARAALAASITSAFREAQKSADSIVPGNPINSGSTQESDDVTVSTSDCNIGGLGWIVCPFIRFLAGITDAAYEYITEMLVVPTSVLFVQNQNAPGSLYKPWSIMRNVANVAFVIAFMIIIYSQITSMGVSNYGIKKMLPRLIISALLVNSSFWIAGLAVELSNVIGQSTYNLLGGADLYSSAPTQPQAEWTTLSDRAVIGLTAGGAVGTGLLTSSILIPILLGAALAIMIAVFVLTIRQAFIIGLIIIAPLAFVAFLLPNTEDWFKRWWKVFKTLLLLFPVIALIFGASSVASQVLNEVAKTYTEPLLKFVMEVMAAGVQILPLFLTTILTNVTQGTLGKLTGMVNNTNKGLLDRSKNFARDRQKYRNEATKAGYGRFGKRKSNWNPMKRAGGFGRTMDKFNRAQKTDMERFDNELETDWRTSNRGGDAVQAQMSSSQNLGKVKVDAEEQNITNPSNTTLQAEVEASNINLAKAKSDLETRNTKNPALTGIQTAAGVAEMQATAAKSELNASIAKEVAHGTSPLGAAGKAAMTDKYISELSKGSSDRVTQQNSAEALQNSSTLQGIAAGADTVHGINRAKGAATQTLDQLGKERVEMEKRSDLRNLDGDALNTIMRDVNGASVERRAAAASLIGVNGEDKHIASMIDYLGDSTDTGIGDIQQQVAQDLKRKPDLFGSADMSKLARAAYGAAEIDPATGNMKGRAAAGRTFESNAIERIKKGKISGSSVASMSPGQIEMFRDMMTTNPRTKFTEKEFDAVQKEILEFRTDPLLQSKQPDVNIQRFMDEIGNFTF